jgi:acyl-CoA thioester hydrolase
MGRTKLELPDEFDFSTEIAVRITDINYGGHLGNDSVLGLVHEARVRFLQHYNYSEIDVEGVSMIMTDAVIVYKSQGFCGDILIVDVMVNDIGRTGCDFLFRMKNKATGKEIARAKTGIAFYDYDNEKIVEVPSEFKKKFALVK